MDWKQQIGKQLRESRDDLNLLQNEVAKKANVHKNMISRYENGDSGPELDVLIRLAAVLDKPEFLIDNHLVTIRAIEAADAGNRILSQPKQLRLKYGEEYLFNSRDTSMKIQPTKEGLYIVSRQKSG